MIPSAIGSVNTIMAPITTITWFIVSFVSVPWAIVPTLIILSLMTFFD